MTLLEICEPLFQYICQLHRVGRSGGNLDYPRARGEVKALFAEMAQKSGAEVKLAGQYRQMELPLMFFADSMIANSALPFAGQWHANRLAYEQKEKAGDEKFFDLLDATLNDPSAESEEQLAVYYVCLGLGFTGMYVGQPEPLRKYMNSIFPRIRHRIDYETHSRLFDEAYKSVDTRSFLEPPSNNLFALAIVLIFLSLSVLVIYYGLFMNASDTLRASLRQVIQQGQSITK